LDSVTRDLLLLLLEDGQDVYRTARGYRGEECLEGRRPAVLASEVGMRVHEKLVSAGRIRLESHAPRPIDRYHRLILRSYTRRGRNAECRMPNAGCRGDGR